MIPSQLLPLANHLWQSTVFACAVALLTMAFRRNRAAVRHGLWVAASVKFLVPLALLITVGSELAGQMAWRKPPVAVRPQIAVAARISEPFAVQAPVPAMPPAPRGPSRIPAVLLGLWLCGFAANCLAWWRGWRRLRAGSPMVLGIFGAFRPRLLLPEGITERLTPTQFQAVIEHELCHARRRDNLTAAIHMTVEALFWFHPLVWWMEARLVEERERACDEEVLRRGHDPQDYAEGIVNVAKLYLESPLVCVAGATGANLKQRVEAIMLNHGARGLNFGRKLLLAAAGAAAIVGPLLLGVVDAPRMRAQTGPKFEVVSIKLCLMHVVGSPGLEVHPGRFRANCLPVWSLLGIAYVSFGNPSSAPVFGTNDTNDPISGGPEWLKTENYDLEAKAEGTPNYRVMEGPMLQAALEDRFKLKIHRETRAVPVYELTVAKGGPKLPRVQAGSCAQLDRTQPAEVANPEHKPWCVMTFSARRDARIVEAHGMSMDRIARSLHDYLDRPVVDRTGLEGLYDFHLEYVPETRPGAGATFNAGPDGGIGLEPAGPSDEPAAGASIFTALQEQMGLKLEPVKGPGEFIVIDSIERPSAN